MRIQCDVCRSGEATVFCCADEAALCGGCDRRVHGANKLAGKHERLPLSPAAAAAGAGADPLVCDLCQERRALFFCQQDRALLCRDCDLRVHAANRLTRNHHRFLLSSINPHPIPNVPTAFASSEVVGSESDLLPPNQVGSATATSELLMPMVLPPGCHAEDLLQYTSTNHHEPYGFSNEPQQQQQQQGYDEISQFLDTVDVESNLGSSQQAADTLEIWAQQSAPPPQCCFSNSNSSVEMGLVEGGLNVIDVHLHAPMSSQLKATASHSHNHRWKDDTLTLLQIRALSSTNFNRSMPF